MGLRINTNIASMASQRNLQHVTSRLQGNFGRLSSGLRIATASDDAAGLGISERMRSQVRSFAVAGRNTQDGISMVQTAEGALDEVTGILVRLRELSTQAASGTLSSTDRTTIDTEARTLLAEIDRVSRATNFNGLTLLNTNVTINVQVGIDSRDVIGVVLEASQSADLGIATVTVGTIAGANNALSRIDRAIDIVTTRRGVLGAAQNRLQSAFASIQNVRENLAAAESRIRDVDVAFETADLTRNTILQQAATAVLAQANVQPQLALNLLA